MRKLWILLTLLLTLITTGCITTKTEEVVLLGRPERKEQPHCTSVKDFGKIINYYEGLIQEWELWGNKTLDTLSISGIKVIELETEVQEEE